MASSWNTGTAVSKVSEVAENVGQKIVDNNKTIKAVSSVASAASSAASAVSSSLPTWQSVVDTAAEAMEGVSSRWTDVAGKAYELLPEGEDVAEALGSISSPVDLLTEGASSAAEAIGNFGTAEARFFLGNFTNPGGTSTEKDLNSKDLEVLTEAVANAKAEGRSNLDYKDFGTSEGEVLKGGLTAGFFDTNMRLARTLGGLNFATNEDGDTVINNTYNFNPGTKRKAYLEAVLSGNDSDALKILTNSISNPVELLSIIGYAKQEELRESGEPFETEMSINLGKV